MLGKTDKSKAKSKGKAEGALAPSFRVKVPGASWYATPAPAKVRMCAKGDKTCSGGSGRGKSVLVLPNVRVSVPKGFNYTTPSAVGGERGAKSRRALGCEEAEYTRKKKDGTEEQGIRFTGRRCVGAPNADGSCREYYVSARKSDGTTRSAAKAGRVAVCGGKAEPCREARKGCNVQLIYRAGKPHLRFCVERNKRGHIVPVNSAAEAHSVAKSVCKSFGYDPRKAEKDVRWPTRQQLDEAKAHGKSVSSYRLGGIKKGKGGKSARRKK